VLNKNSSVPAFVPSTGFFRGLSVSFEFGAKMVALGILKADATLNDRPIFKADLETLERARAAVGAYRVRVAKAHHNLLATHGP
jgi:hypothetical protein